MKKHLLFIITGLTLLWNYSSQAAGPPGSLGEGDGYNSNPHNLSANSSSGANIASTETQICIFCHTPHGATPKSSLWSRPAPTGPYGDGTFPFLVGTLKIDDVGIVDKTHYSAVEATEGYPNGTSKLCLSCHDGVTAMGIFANGDEITMTGNGLIVTPKAIIDLTTTHPISFIYTAEIAGLLGATYIYPGAGSIYLETDSSGITRVQCTTCHQPHQDTFVNNSLPFWRLDTGNNNNDYDNVCLSCHTAVPNSQSNEHNY